MGNTTPAALIGAAMIASLSGGDALAQPVENYRVGVVATSDALVNVAQKETEILPLSFIKSLADIIKAYPEQRVTIISVCSDLYKYGKSRKGKLSELEIWQAVYNTIQLNTNWDGKDVAERLKPTYDRIADRIGGYRESSMREEANADMGDVAYLGNIDPVILSAVGPVPPGVFGGVPDGESTIRLITMISARIGEGPDRGMKAKKLAEEVGRWYISVPEAKQYDIPFLAKGLREFLERKTSA